MDFKGQQLAGEMPNTFFPISSEKQAVPPKVVTQLFFPCACILELKLCVSKGNILREYE